MLIKIRRGWEIPERMATPEELVFDRRRVLKSAGALALAGALANCGPASDTQTVSSGGEATPETPDPNASIYPAKHNDAYTLDRAVTPEEIVTNYCNYYEFGSQKDDPPAMPVCCRSRPWEVSFEGMVEEPRKTRYGRSVKGDAASKSGFIAIGASRPGPSRRPGRAFR